MALAGTRTPILAVEFRGDRLARKRRDSSAARWAELKQFYITVHMAELTHENPKIPP